MNASRQRAPRQHLIISGLILALFWGALLVEYWPDLALAVVRLTNSARSVGADKVESRYFDVVNLSSASTAQVERVIRQLEQQYQAIAGYTQSEPIEPIPVMLSDGSGPALTDGAQLMLTYGYGHVDIDLVPMFLVWMLEGIPVTPQEGLVPAGGYALQVVEDSGLGEQVIRQPLDDWVTLLRKKKAYLPLEEAWQLVLPSDEPGAYELICGMVEAGSFMHWFVETYGNETAERLVRGEDIQTLTGKTLAEMEAEWLQSLDGQETQPKNCSKVIPRASQLYLFCRGLEGQGFH